MSDNLQVIKRDGTAEEFDQEKIIKVVVASGLTQIEGERLAEKIAEWAKSQSSDKVTSLVLRDKVLEELQEVNPYAANLFSWYQKTKEE